MVSDTPKFLAIIPARGGSKRLPRKNVLDLGGKPLIAWSIEAGIKSRYIEEVMVTTDDDEISLISKEYGAHVPFRRPDHLSNDTAHRNDVIQHALMFYENELGRRFDYVVFLQPTSPLRNSSHIDDAIRYLLEKNADAIISVCEVEHPVQWSGVLPGSKDISNFLTKEAIESRSQDLQIHHRLNGALFIFKTDRFLEEGCIFFRDNIYAYIMEQDVSVDIDTKIDFLLAEAILKS